MSFTHNNASNQLARQNNIYEQGYSFWRPSHLKTKFS